LSTPHGGISPSTAGEAGCILAAMTHPLSLKNRPLIGFLATQFDESYQYAVWNGAAEEALALGIPLVFYEGTNANNPGSSNTLDSIPFCLAKKNNLSGLIVMSNAMGASLTYTRTADYLATFEHIPLISLGIKFPGIPSLCVGNTGCIQTITTHVVVVHNRKNFVFLAGPRGHQEGEGRKREFQETIRTLLPGSPPPKVMHCDFSEERAYTRIKRLIESGWNYDAVVAANDQMALGAIRALEESGLEVPGDVSVTGFDNIEDSMFSIPPLTTIHQPMGELGRNAVRFIANRLGLLVQEKEMADLSSTCIIRTSCGCTGSQSMPLEADLDTKIAIRLQDDTIEHRLRYQVSQRVAAQTRLAILRKIESSLIVSFRMEDMLGELVKGVKQLDIRFCALVLFDSKQGNLEWSDLLMLSDERATRILAPYGLRFRTMDLLPNGLPFDAVTFICEPLQFGNERLGYLVCSADSPDRHIYAALRDQISTALKGALIMAVERDRERALEAEVNHRTMELSLSNKQLKDEISQRKNLERELLDISNNIMSRIGQDIHDDLCQDIAGIGVLAATLEGSLKRSGHVGTPLAAQIATTASQTALHAKQIARELYPTEFEENGIISAVTQLVESKRERLGPLIDLEIQNGFFIRSPEKALQLYRIIQEALNNAIRHSHGDHIRVGLYMDHGMVTVEVTDNGKGMDTAGKSECGMGLMILKYRANVIDGKLRIKSDDTGTVVSCRVAR